MISSARQRDGAGLRVLYLVPPGDAADEPSAFSFLSEEIDFLIDCGVEAVIAVPEGGHEYSGHFTKVVAPARSLGEIFGTVRFLLRHWRLVWPALIRHPRQCLYHGRFEKFVAETTEKFDVHLIHSHFAWPAGWGGVLAAQTRRLPLVTSLRGMDIIVDESIDYGNRRDPFYASAIRVLLSHAQHVTAVSDYILGQALELGARQETSTTILKGVHLEKFIAGRAGEDARAELGLENVLTVLSVGGLIRRKGMDRVIEAFAAVPEPAQLVICGRGPEQENLASLAQRLGISERVLFKGQVDRDSIPTYFSACDVFVLASRNEASGNVLCEALATGRPVVTTRSGGPPEYVTHGETGFVAAPDDAQEMAAYLIRLQQDEALRERLGAAARRAAESRFAYDRMIGDILAIYKRVTGR